MKTHFEHDFSDVRLYSDSQAHASARDVSVATYASREHAEYVSSKGGLQRALAIGASNDPFEEEADRVADQVMAAPAHPAASGAPVRIQRFTGYVSEGTETAPASVDRVLASNGKPLETALRQDMEQRFGHDFSQVRVHTDAVAAQSTHDVNANAYTAGQHIVFGTGYAPASHEGRRLLAHELTHVVQQSVGFQHVLSRQSAPVSGTRPTEVLPRSLITTLNPKGLGDQQIVSEIESISSWLDRRDQSDPKQDEQQLKLLSELGSELMRRHPEVVSAVRDQLAEDPAGSVALALAPAGPWLLAELTKTGVKIAGQRAIQSGATALATAPVAGASGAAGGGGAVGGVVGGVSTLGLGLWAVLIFVFFAPRGETLDPKTQDAIAKAIRESGRRAATQVPQAPPKPPLADPATSGMRDRRKQVTAPEIDTDPQADSQADTDSESKKDLASKRKRTCEVEHRNVPRCDGSSDTRRTYYVDRASALNAAKKQVKLEPQSRPTRSQDEKSKELPGAFHVTLWFADGTKISLGYTKQCCIEIMGVPILHDVELWYVLNTWDMSTGGP